MLFRHDPEDVRDLLNSTSSGTVILVGSLGGKGRLPTVEAALAKVLTLEKRAATAAKAVAYTRDIGGLRGHAREPVRSHAIIAGRRGPPARYFGRQPDLNTS